MRIRYYDYLETIAMFLVITMHQGWLKNTLACSISMALAPMAVPLFFMIHGALLLTKDASPAKQAKRILRVLLQMLFWNTVYLLLSMVHGLISPSQIGLGFLLRYYVGNVNPTGIPSSHFWFLHALLVIYFLFPLLDACKKQNEKVLKYVMLLCFVLSFVREAVLVYGNFFCQKFLGKPLVTDWLIARVGPYFNAVFWFIAGFYLSRWLREHPELKEHKAKYICLALCCVALGFALQLVDRYVSYGSFKYNWKPLPGQYEKFGALILAFSFFFIFSLIEFKDGRFYSLIRSISSHTQDIFYIHVIYTKLFLVYLYRSDLCGVWMNYARSLTALVLSYLTGLLLSKIPLIKKLL